MKLSLLVTLAALAVGGSALAQQPGPGTGAGLSPDVIAAREAMRAACAADFKTLCDGKQGREMMMCLRDNADRASQPCRDAMAKMPPRQPRPPAG
jgi:multidrug efflux system membrane fusion protein